MTNDYISRQAALDALGVTKNATKYGGDHSGYDTRMLYEIHDVLTGLPSADAVQVVRCKDCKFCCRNDAQDWYWCERGLVVIKVRPDDFCSQGKRREE